MLVGLTMFWFSICQKWIRLNAEIYLMEGWLPRSILTIFLHIFCLNTFYEGIHKNSDVMYGLNCHYDFLLTWEIWYTFIFALITFDKLEAQSFFYAHFLQMSSYFSTFNIILILSIGVLSFYVQIQISKLFPLQKKFIDLKAQLELKLYDLSLFQSRAEQNEHHKVLIPFFLSKF